MYINRRWRTGLELSISGSAYRQAGYGMILSAPLLKHSVVHSSCGEQLDFLISGSRFESVWHPPNIQGWREIAGPLSFRDRGCHRTVIPPWSCRHLVDPLDPTPNLDKTISGLRTARSCCPRKPYPTSTYPLLHRFVAGATFLQPASSIGNCAYSRAIWGRKPDVSTRPACRLARRDAEEKPSQG